MIVADLDQHLGGQPTVFDEFETVLKWYDIVGLTVQDRSDGFDGRCRSPLLSSGAEENERRVAGHNVDGNGTTTAGTNDNSGLVLIVVGLGDLNSCVEVVVGQSWIENFVAVIFEVRRFAATGDAGPAVEEEYFHFGFRLALLVLTSNVFKPSVELESPVYLQAISS